MNYKSILGALGLGAFGGLLSCSGSGTAEQIADGLVPADTVVYTADLDTIPSGVICGLEWIPLRGSRNGLFGNISKLIVRDSLLVVIDRPNCKAVAFNKQGDLLYQIANRGQGPEEYLEIAAASASDSVLYILDNYSHRLQQYSLADGSYVGAISVPFVAWDFEMMSDNDFLFTCLNNSPDSEIVPKPMDYAVWRTDSTMAVTHTYLPLPENYFEMIGKRRYFTTDNEGNVIFHCYRYPGFFTFTQDPAQEPAFHYVNFGRSIPADKGLTHKDVRKKKYNYLEETPFVYDDNWIGLTTHHRDWDYIQVMLWHKASGKLLTNSQKWAGNHIIYEMVGVNEDGVIAYLSSGQQQYDSLIEHGFPRADSIAEKHIEQDDCALVIYRFCKD